MLTVNRDIYCLDFISSRHWWNLWYLKYKWYNKLTCRSSWVKNSKSQLRKVILNASSSLMLWSTPNFCWLGLTVPHFGLKDFDLNSNTINSNHISMNGIKMWIDKQLRTLNVPWSVKNNFDRFRTKFGPTKMPQLWA